MLVIGCSSYAQVTTRVPWPDLPSAQPSITALNEFAERFNPKYRFTHINPSATELDGALQEIEMTIKHTKMAVFVFILGYFKAPLFLLLPFKDHSSGHYVAFDLHRLQWPNTFV